MEWLKVNDMSGNVIRMPIDRIDHIVEDPYSIAAELHFKNGKHCMVDATSFYKTELRPITDYDPTDLWKEIEDLKIENDRLKKRDELMCSLICDATCHTSCDECRFNIEREPCKLNICRLDSTRYRELMNEFYSVFEKLEEL